MTTHPKISHRERHHVVRDLFEPSAALYWPDFTLSTFAGWSGFIVAVSSASSFTWVVATLVSVLALYRAVLFTHELVHVRCECLPGFRTFWNLCCGIPLLVPSFLYDGVHQEHHFRRNYGTPGDGEYLPFGSPPRSRMFIYLVSHILFPPLIFLRFALLGPLSWFSARLRMIVWERLSSLSIDHAYKRPVPGTVPTVWIVQESLCSVYAWSIVILIYLNIIPLQVLLQLYVVSVAILVLNAVRTLAAHRYSSDGETMSFEEQLADSVNIIAGGFLTPLIAPVGLRYHALHHLLPTIPYHNLGEAHRRLINKLPDDPVYRGTMVNSVWQALRELWSACGNRSMQQSRVSV